MPFKSVARGGARIMTIRDRSRSSGPIVDYRRSTVQKRFPAIATGQRPLQDRRQIWERLSHHRNRQNHFPWIIPSLPLMTRPKPGTSQVDGPHAKDSTPKSDASVR